MSWMRLRILACAASLFVTGWVYANPSCECGVPSGCYSGYPQAGPQSLKAGPSQTGHRPCPGIDYAQPSDWDLFMHTIDAASQPTMAYCQPATQGACQPIAPLSDSFRGLYGGFEFLWMRANFDQNVALIIDPPVGNTSVPFDYSYELSPRVWLGWESCRGGGFRSTYFRFDEAADTESVTAVAGSTPVFLYVYGAGGNLSRNAEANVGEALTSNHQLKIEALDFEATQRLNWNSLRATLGGGVRIARMDQYTRGDVRDGAGALQESVSNDLKWTGAGPTVSLQIRRALAESRLSMFGGLRGSLLMGETQQKIYEMKGAFTTELEDAATQHEILTAMEMSIGLQWTQSIGRYSRWFARGGYETQAWFDAGGPVDSSSTVSLDAVTFAIGMQF